MNASAPIWLTRPRDDSQRMADMLAARGIASVIAPLMTIKSKRVEWPFEKPQALFVTSRYAAATLSSAPSNWRDINVYCVGPATAKVVQQQGFCQTIIGPGGVLKLVPKLRSMQRAGDTVIYPCGEDIRIDIAPLLRPHGITATRLIAYRAEAVETLPASLLEQLAAHALQGAILCSPRAVKAVHALLSAHDLLAALHAMDIYCLNRDIANAAQALGCTRLHVCPTATYEAMAALITTHAQQASA